MDLRKLGSVLVIASSLLTWPAQGAELAGRVWFEKGKRPATNVRIAVECAGNKRIETRTDKYGFYRRSGIPPKQSCYIFIDDGQHYAAPLAFYSGQGRETLNFALMIEDSTLIVKKR